MSENGKTNHAEPDTKCRTSQEVSKADYWRHRKDKIKAKKQEIKDVLSTLKEKRAELKLIRKQTYDEFVVILSSGEA